MHVIHIKRKEFSFYKKEKNSKQAFKHCKK